MSHSLPNPEPESHPEQPRNRLAVVDLIVFAIFSLIAVAGLALASTKLPTIYILPLQGVFDVVLVLFIWGWIRIVRDKSFSQYLHLFWSTAYSTRRLIVLGGLLAISVSIVSAFLPSTDQMPLEKLLSSKSAISLFVILGVTVAPLMEEIIFRGFLFQVLSEIGGFRLAVPGSALLFALPHFGQLGNFGALALILIVGSLLSVLRHRSSSVIPPWIVHTSYNATLFALFVVGAILQKLLK